MQGTLMKKSLFIFSVFLLAGSVSGERIVWGGKSLTWTIFKGKPDTQSTQASLLSYAIEYSCKPRGFLVTNFDFEITGFVDGDKSWVKDGAQSDALLSYNQIIFDIVELHRRNLRKRFNRTTFTPSYRPNQANGAVAEKIFSNEMDCCGRRIAQFQAQTGYGLDSLAVASWKRKITDELERNPEELVPPFTRSKISFYGDFAVGGSYYGWKIGDHFPASARYDFVAGVAFDNLFLSLIAGSGSSKSENSFSLGTTWPQSTQAVFTSAGLSAGYRFLDAPRLSLIAFAGPCLAEIAPFRKTPAIDSKAVASAIVGVEADYKFLTRMGFNGPHKGETSLYANARLFVAPMFFSRDFRGYSINCLIGIGGIGRGIRVE
jgi:hypothetical protein